MSRFLLFPVTLACSGGSVRVATWHPGGVDLVDPPGLEEAVLTDGGTLLLWSEPALAEAGLDAAGQVAAASWELPVRMEDAVDGEPTWLAIVTVPWPWYATRGLVVDAFRDRVPEYAAIGGLPHKDFLLTDDRLLGGVYRWTSAEAAAAWYTAEWRADLEDRYGEPPTLQQHAILEVR